MARAKKQKTITAITHGDSRKTIPTAEYQSVMKSEELHPVQVAYERRNRDLDPQVGVARKGRAGRRAPGRPGRRLSTSRRRSIRRS